MARKYTTVNVEAAFRIRTGRYGGFAIDCRDNGWWFQQNSLTTVDTVVAGFAANFLTVATYPTYMFFGFYDGSTQGVWLRRNTGGAEIEVCRGSGATLLGTTSGANLQDNTWCYIELKVKCNSSTGTVDIQVDGVNVLSLTGQNTQAGSHAYHDGFHFEGISDNLPKIDDFYFLDTSGSANNDFLGKQRVVTVFPNAVGATGAWTGSNGSPHYSLVNENPADDDTTYVESNTTGQEELWNYTNPAGIGSIAGVKVNTDCRVTDGTPFTLDTMVLSGATGVSDGGQSISSTGYTTVGHIFEQDPATSSAWGATGVNNAQFGVKVG
jgi:hypothetical protein